VAFRETQAHLRYWVGVRCLVTTDAGYDTGRDIGRSTIFLAALNHRNLNDKGFRDTTTTNRAASP